MLYRNIINIIYIVDNSVKRTSIAQGGRIVRPFSLGTYQVHDSFPVVFELSETTGDESNLVPYEMMFALNIPAQA